MTDYKIFGNSAFLRHLKTGDVWVEATFMYNTFGGRLMNWLALATLVMDDARWIPIHIAAERLVVFPGADNKDKFLELVNST